MLAWIKREMDPSRMVDVAAQEANWTVAITVEGAMIVSKVGGVTSGTSNVPALSLWIQDQAWWPDLSGLYLAKKFTKDGVSNHAEMCILAAVDSLEMSVAKMGCASDNCEACGHVLIWDGTDSLNDMSTSPQQGWVHPRGRMGLGLQVNDQWAKQILELDKFNDQGPANYQQFEFKWTKELQSDPKGQFEYLGAPLSR
ncbi:hypothetical protein ACFV2V_24135 [Streptomyces sp. NPDC059698]|uniref:hypothetical protein n=1 Tax=Streptomyces TaxID=1883 RepID=UPI0011611C51|nr:hypothetical protein [Streptomyces sp. CB02366]